ncbi:helix-turn-helix domain-containing protein [Martelella sp. HB161492]|uniref:helix-turn-helix domain-containing protein n=1 Tax=Martelella sp. HB161492 TaxID=2720726 RepID=UPI0015929955|nr:helix-turn-helix domain-containing protein [Martelella sp. HB161492]
MGTLADITDRSGTVADSLKLNGDTLSICRVVRLLTFELGQMGCLPAGKERLQRRGGAHLRQMAMYVCHVALGLSLNEIGQGFGRDRTTVAYACRKVEDWRDDSDYDAFVTRIERLAIEIVVALGLGNHG